MSRQAGAQIYSVPITDGTRALYAGAAAQARERREKLFRRLKLDAVRVRPGDDYVAPLAALFRARARRRG